MTDIPPLPNSVYAQPPNAKHQVKDIETQRMQAKEINRHKELVTTYYDQKTYIYKNGELSQTTPKVIGQQIMATV